MAWRYEMRNCGLIQGTSLPLLRDYLIDDEHKVEIYGGRTTGGWLYVYRDPDVEFEFRTSAAGSNLRTNEFPGPECEIILSRTPFLPLSLAVRQRIGKTIEDYLLHLHLIPHLVARGRHVERCWFSDWSRPLVDGSDLS